MTRIKKFRIEEFGLVERIVAGHAGGRVNADLGTGFLGDPFFSYSASVQRMPTRNAIEWCTLGTLLRNVDEFYWRIIKNIKTSVQFVLCSYVRENRHHHLL